jgi:hypothetical protein
MIARDVDALELDCFSTGKCYAQDHGHAPGADLWPVKLEFMRRVRAEARRLNPDFALFFETIVPESRTAADGWYCYRLPDEHGRIQRFLFPSLRQEAVRILNYGFDAVNRSLQLGVGAETEIWGLRTTTLDGCPDLAQYIGQITRLRRRYADILIQGTFRDTLGATITVPQGKILFYSVLDAGQAGKALVLRNPSREPVAGSATLAAVHGRRLVLARPNRKDQMVRQQPLAITLGPYQAAVLLALPQ